MVCSLLIVGCEPVEDIENEINTEIDNTPVSGISEYTLVEEDYTDILELDFANFSNNEEAKTLVPDVLTDLYPFWGKGSQVLVTYNLYSPQPEVEGEPIEYTLVEDDYAPYTEYGNFDNYEDIKDFLSNKYPNAEEGQLILLTFDFYSGSVNTLTQGFLFEGSEWLQTTSVTEAQYEEMGHGQYYNFNSEDQAETKLSILLNNTVSYETIEEDSIKRMLYKYYDGETLYQVANFIYTNQEWMLLTNIATESLKFGHDGETWVPDNTIKYEFVEEDYSTIEAALSAEYPNATSSASNYGNFDRREGTDAYWNDAMILEAINVVLDELNPDAENGQKYELTYAVYNGTNTTETVFVIKEDGAWIYNPDA